MCGVQPYKACEAGRNTAVFKPANYGDYSSLIICKPFLIQDNVECLRSLRFYISKQSIFGNALYKYDNPVDQRDQIRKDNINKSGVYAWINKINQKFYVGSGTKLYKRIADYYQPWYLSARPNLTVIKALNKYGMINFYLVILEHTDKDSLIKCEQKWIDQLKSEYNISKLAGNTLGYKHTLETIKTMKNRIVLEETKLKMSISAKNRLKREGKRSHFEGKKHSEKSLALMKRFKVEITDIEKNKISTYNSIQSAVKGIGYAISSVLRWRLNIKILMCQWNHLRESIT